MTNTSQFHQSSSSNSRSQDKINAGNTRGSKSRHRHQEIDPADFEEFDGNLNVTQAPGFQSQQQILEGIQQRAPQTQSRIKLTYDNNLGTSNIEGTYTGLSEFNLSYQQEAEHQPGQDSARDPRIRSHHSQRLSTG